MNRPGPERISTTAAAALNEVLSAERQAQQAVAACRRQGEEVVSQGRGRGRRILERAEQRITALRAQSDLTLSRTVAALAAEGAALPDPAAVDPEQLARLDQAVAALATELTGTER